MDDIEIVVDGGTQKRLLTAGKYCDRNILITATAAGGEPEQPDDGKTRLYITVPANSDPSLPPPRNKVPLYIQQTVENGVTIDWGDGSEPETLPGTGNVNINHEYQTDGDFIITLDPIEGCVLNFGHNSISTCVMGQNSTDNRVYSSMLFKVIVGSKGVTKIAQYAFQNCYGLKSIYIPENVTSIERNAFNYCCSMSSIDIPSSIVSIGANAFQYCYSLFSILTSDRLTSIGAYAFFGCFTLASFKIPNGVNSIESRMFYNCYSLSSIEIPYSVKNINDNAFSGCYCVAEYHFKPTIPPTMSNENAFDGISPDCVIYVPVGSLEAYQTATNWSTYSAQMREEST